MPEQDCLFCKIVKKEVASDIIDENDEVLVIKDIHPKAPVHLLILSKRHVPSVKDLKGGDSELAAAMILQAQKTAGANGMNGYKLVFNVGREGGQVIDHLHLHLLGGWGNVTNKVEV